MSKDQRTHQIQDIEFEVIYSRRRTLGISVLPDSSVIVRVPYLTSIKTINRIVQQKAAWIIKHRDSYKEKEKSKLNGMYVTGETHLFRGNESVLKIEKSSKAYVRFYEGTIELGLDKTDDARAIKWLLYQGYKNEALIVFPDMLSNAVKKYENQMFRPTGLVIRTMKRRWGGCSNKGIITLSTELIKLPDIYIEYVILHELCHLKHHNHGREYYRLLSEVFPDYKQVRKELRKYIQ
ncbi:MAG: SprT family zinc-dependent metalloprotease [Bacteroidia bacterium]|nr:SprT family zinc-dependent metalloprotease [Bacteroidia bacterium]